jgi:glycosyl transferase family 2
LRPDVSSLAGWPVRLIAMNQIISFSLYGTSPFYCEGAIRNVELARSVYPGWRCRFYVGESVPSAYLDALRQYGAEVIPVRKNLGPTYGRFWRLWVAADPTVDRFIVRDVDSRVNPREKTAVEAWLDSGKAFHLMRDSVQHPRRMLAGMWGGMGAKLPDMPALIDAWGRFGESDRTDQFMSEVVFPLIQADCLCHDSVGYYDDARPFPPHPPLEGTRFIGDRVAVDGAPVDIWRQAGELEDKLLLVKIARASLDHQYKTPDRFERAARKLLPEIADIVTDAREHRIASEERLSVINVLKIACEERQKAIDRLTAALEGRQIDTDDASTPAERQDEIDSLKRICREQQAVIASLSDIADHPVRGDLQRYIGYSIRFISTPLRRFLRPNLGRFEQYVPRPLAPSLAYRSKTTSTELPSIAIVTPTLDQTLFVRRTIDSVMDQGYPKLRYRVQDGGSTDGTLAILESYGASLEWESEADSGQADAINKGFSHIEGEIMAWLNSDDVYLPGTLAYVADFFRAHPQVDFIYGNRVFIDAADRDVGRYVLPPHDSEALKLTDFVPQETMFWRSRVWKAVGPIDTTFSYALDWDFILRAQQAGFLIRHVPRFLGCFRVHAAQKTTAMHDIGQAEMQRLRLRHLGRAMRPPEISRGLRRYLLSHVAVDRAHRVASWASRLWRLLRRPGST